MRLLIVVNVRFKFQSWRVVPLLAFQSQTVTSSPQDQGLSGLLYCGCGLHRPQHAYSRTLQLLSCSLLPVVVAAVLRILRVVHVCWVCVL